MPSHHATSLAACLVLAATLGGCALPDAAAPVETGLQGPRWTLAALQGQALPAELPLAALPYVEFRGERLAGSGGCNRIAGPVQLQGSGLKLGPAVATRMACVHDTGLEQRFVQVFEQVAVWRIEGGALLWLGPQGEVLARFDQRVSTWSCEGGGPVLAAYEPSSAGMRLLLQGREFKMRPAPAASGERYVVEQGRRSDWSMEWHAKGDEALLLEAPLSDHRKPEDLQIFLRCKRG